MGALCGQGDLTDHIGVGWFTAHGFSEPPSMKSKPGYLILHYDGLSYVYSVAHQENVWFFSIILLKRLQLQQKFNMLSWYLQKNTYRRSFSLPEGIMITQYVQISAFKDIFRN